MTMPHTTPLGAMTADGSTQLVTNDATQSNDGSAFRVLAAWLVMIALVALFAQFEAGRFFLYYLLVMSIVLLLLTQANAIKGVLAPITGAKT